MICLVPTIVSKIGIEKCNLQLLLTIKIFLFWPYFELFLLCLRLHSILVRYAAIYLHNHKSRSKQNTRFELFLEMDCDLKYGVNFNRDLTSSKLVNSMEQLKGTLAWVSSYDFLSMIDELSKQVDMKCIARIFISQHVVFSEALSYIYGTESYFHAFHQDNFYLTSKCFEIGINQAFILY